MVAIKILAGIAKDGTHDAARVSAAVALLDRGWGKPPQAHTGEDDKNIHVSIRQIVERRDDD
jgi:predicted SpoU family rRNA methylase